MILAGNNQALQKEVMVCSPRLSKFVDHDVRTLRARVIVPTAARGKPCFPMSVHTCRSVGAQLGSMQNHSVIFLPNFDSTRLEGRLRWLYLPYSTSRTTIIIMQSLQIFTPLYKLPTR